MWRWSFLVTACCLTIPNHESLSSRWTGIRNWKNGRLIELDARKPSIESYFTKTEGRAETRQLRLEFDNFQPQFNNRSSNASPCFLALVCFLGRMSGVFWKMKSKPIKRHRFRLLTHQLFFCIRICCLWTGHRRGETEGSKLSHSGRKKNLSSSHA